MPPRQDPVPRARAAVQWLSGLLLLGFLAAGVVAAAAALWENVDVRSLARRAAAVDDARPAPPVEDDGPLASHGRPAAAGLYESPASRGYFPDSTYYDKALAAWERRMRKAVGPAPRVRGVRGVEALPAGALLVAPEAVCLSDEEVEAFRRHLARGGGLVLDWATAARDETCAWRGWEPLRSLTGSLDLVEVPAEPSLFLTVPGGLPVSPGLPPGARIELFPEPHLALQVAGARAYWSDWALNAAGAGAPGPDAALALHEPEDGGRVAWFGFRERQAVAERDARRVGRLLHNGLLWAGGAVTAEMATWPDGHRAALLVAEDVETGFENAAGLARLLRARGVVGTFFPVSGMALKHPALADSLRGAGEVGSQTADHVSPAGLPEDEQAVRLGRSVRELESWTGQPVVGLRPPEERFDEATVRAWSRVGGTYVAALNEARSAAPEIFPSDAGPVVLLPRLLKDDYNIFVQEGARRTDLLRDAWLEGIRKIEALGGFAYLSLHSQIAGSPDRVEVVGEVLDSVTARPAGWWIATGGEIADWWTMRDGARLSIDARADTLVLRIAPSPRGAPGAWVDVFLPRGSELRPHAAERPLAWAPTEWGIRFPAPADGDPDATTEILLHRAAATGEAGAASAAAGAEVPGPG